MTTSNPVGSGSARASAYQSVARGNDNALSGTNTATADNSILISANGILALTGYERPEPAPIFDAPFSLAVRTGLTPQG